MISQNQMNRILGYILALAVLSGIAYGIYILVPRGPALSTVPVTDTSSGTEMKAEVVYGSTDTYRIEVRYPQFGIPAVDEKIKAVVDKAVAEFKTYPANPPDSAVAQNELTGSFDSTYVGADVARVALSLSEYTGGAHPNTVIIGVNVDRATGTELSLDDALAMIGKTLSQVADQSVPQITKALVEEGFGEDAFFAAGAEAKTDNYSTLLVSKDRITFVFNNYQVGPYAAAQQYVW